MNFKLPSFKKLRSKLSIRKSHSTASNLADIAPKAKLSNSNSSNNIKTITVTQQQQTPSKTQLILNAAITQNYNPNNNNINSNLVNNNNNKSTEFLNEFPQKLNSSSNNHYDIDVIQEEQIGQSNTHLDELHQQQQQQIEQSLSTINLNTNNLQVQPSSSSSSSSLNHTNIVHSNTKINSNSTVTTNTTTSNDLTPKSSKTNGTDSSPYNLKSSTNTPNKHQNPIAEFLSSLSSSFSLSSSSSSSNQQSSSANVKLRQKKNKPKQSEIQKRISLPANYISNTTQIQQQQQTHQEDVLIEGENDDELNKNTQVLLKPPAEITASHFKTSQFKSSLLNTKNIGFNSNHQISSSLANNAKMMLTQNSKTIKLNPALNYAQHHIQSFQSLSSVSDSNSQFNPKPLFLMKPLNRNSRRASMSELGYGKIESYNKLEKLGEVNNAKNFN